MSGFDDFLLERGLAPLGPSTAQETAPAKLAALEAELGVKAAASDAMAGRLEAVEQAEAARKAEIRKLEIANYKFRKSIEAGLDPALLDDMPLDDEAVIDKKIGQFAELAAKAGALAIRAQWGANASRPGPAMPVPTGRPTQREYEAQFEALSSSRR